MATLQRFNDLSKLVHRSGVAGPNLFQRDPVGFAQRVLEKQNRETTPRVDLDFGKTLGREPR